MITRFLSKVSVAFNPFSARGRTARLFMSLLPPDARQSGMKIDMKVLERSSREGGKVEVVFKDGKQINLDTSKMSIKDVVEEMDRHSRTLARAEELSG